MWIEANPVKSTHAMRLNLPFKLWSIPAWRRCILKDSYHLLIIQWWALASSSVAVAIPIHSDYPRGVNSIPRFEKLANGVAFRNRVNAIMSSSRQSSDENVYHRVSHASKLDIEIFVFDSNGNPIHNDYRKHIHNIYEVIYGWNPAVWHQRLVETPQGTLYATRKANLFFESLSQHFAEHLFGEPVSDSVLVYGLDCLNSLGRCSENGISGAERIVVKTTIRGSQDPLNPVTRTIYWEASRKTLHKPEVGIVLEVPARITVDSRYQERLDFRPRIRSGYPIVSLEILIEINEHVNRVKETDYPDFNIVYIPIRHLLLQGQVSNPKQLGETIEYVDQIHFRAAFNCLMTRLSERNTALDLARELRDHYLTFSFYYMHGDVKHYANYILSEDTGVAAGLRKHHIDSVQIRVNRSVPTERLDLRPLGPAGVCNLSE